MVKTREAQNENKKRHSSNRQYHQHLPQNNMMDVDIEVDDRILLNNGKNSKSIPEQLGEILASNEIGQYIIVKLHKLLWILENTTKWSCPGIAEKNLIRPLPWIFFLPTIVFMQFIRTGLSIMSRLKAVITISNSDNTYSVMPDKMIHTMQVWRRHLRSLRYEGIRTIQKRNQAVTNFINSFKELLNNCIYTPPILLGVNSKKLQHTIKEETKKVKVDKITKRNNAEVENAIASNEVLDNNNVSDDEEELEALEELKKLLNTTITEEDFNSDEDKTFKLNDFDYSGDESVGSSAYESLNECITEIHTKKRRNRRRNRRNSKANKENNQQEKLVIASASQSLNSQNDGDDVGSNYGGSLSASEPTSSGFNSTDLTAEIRALELSPNIDKMNTSHGNQNNSEQLMMNYLNMKNNSSSLINGDTDNSDSNLNADNYEYDREDEDEVDEYHQSSEDSEFYNKENESTYKSLNDSSSSRIPISSLSPTSIVDQFYKETK